MLLSGIAVAGREYRIELWNEKVYVSPLEGNGDEIDCACFEPTLEAIREFEGQLQKATGDLLSKLDWEAQLEEQQEAWSYQVA